MTTELQSFKDAYKILETHAERLAPSDNDLEIDIDELAGIMEESNKAYKFCMERIANVKKVIDSYADTGNIKDSNIPTSNAIDIKDTVEVKNDFDSDIPF